MIKIASLWQAIEIAQAANAYLYRLPIKGYAVTFERAEYQFLTSFKLNKKEV
jgi:hypothetical protein